MEPRLRQEPNPIVRDIQKSIADAELAVKLTQERLEIAIREGTPTRPFESLLQSTVDVLNFRRQALREAYRQEHPMMALRRALLSRDGCCVATGVAHAFITRILPPDKFDIPRDFHYSPLNAVVLSYDLQMSYKKYHWIFDTQGTVIVLYDYSFPKIEITQLNLSSDPQLGPASHLIEVHNEHARYVQANSCPVCWKFVGASNIENHRNGHCEDWERIDSDRESECDCECSLSFGQIQLDQ
jgi:hypothetical protein